MTLPLISGYAAALISVFQIALMVTAVLARRAEGVSLGDDSTFGPFVRAYSLLIVGAYSWGL